MKQDNTMKNNQYLNKTLTIATLAMMSPNAYSAEEVINKGPYNITINSNGEFGYKDYHYEFSVSDSNKILLNKKSESTIKGYEINKASLFSKDGKLWFVYQEVVDGLDPRSIFLVQVSQGNIEQAQASFTPDDPEKNFKLLSVPQGWNTGDAGKLLKQALGITESPKPKAVTEDTRKEKPTSSPVPPTNPRSMEW